MRRKTKAAIIIPIILVAAIAFIYLVPIVEVPDRCFPSRISCPDWVSFSCSWFGFGTYTTPYGYWYYLTNGCPT